jgi:hypothetical protein
VDDPGAGSCRPCHGVVGGTVVGYDDFFYQIPRDILDDAADSLFFIKSRDDNRNFHNEGNPVTVTVKT